MWKFCLALTALLITPVSASELDLRPIVDKHILPGYQGLADRSADLSASAKANCGADLEKVKNAYHLAFDAWVGVSHLRFGPSEIRDRAYALAFWPDTKGFTPKSLSSLLRTGDAAIHDLEQFQTVTIAARGFYALDFLFYDAAFTKRPDPNYCALVQVISADIAANSAAILQDWQTDYADRIAVPGNDTYRTWSEAAQQLFTSLTTGLEFTAQSRLGRPMGSFSRPRPNRAEARRSGRSLRHVALSLAATRDLAVLMSGGAAEFDADIDASFERAIKLAAELDDPTLAGVSQMQGRIRIEALQGAITMITEQLALNLGPKLGIAAGFNALDGD